MEPIAIIAGVFVLIVLLVKAISSTTVSADSIGAYGEAMTARCLSLLPVERYSVLNDLMVCDKRGITTQIDHVVLSQYGIFVVETKCYSGWIFGDERSRVWTQTLSCGRGWWAYSEKYKFQNPIRQNWRHIYVLVEMLNLPKRYFHNVVVFSGDADFKTDVPRNVIDITSVDSYIKSFDNLVMSAKMCERLYNKLLQLNASVSEEKRTRHVHTLHVTHAPPPTVNEHGSPPLCPICDATMRLRHRRSDGAPFYGCSHYPQCKGIANVKK